MTVTLSESVELPATRTQARIEVGRQDSWRAIGSGQGRELTVLHASLKGQVVLRGIRYAFHRL
jgi:hypothetical protein